MDRRSFNSLALASALSGSFGLSGCQGDAAASLSGKALPAIKGSYSDGAGFELSAIALPAIIRVWGLWCPPCLVDEPHWQAVVRALRTGPDAVQGLNILAIHVGRPPSNGPSLEEWVRAQAPDIAVPQVDDVTNAIMTQIGIPGTPSTLIVDGNGIIKEHAWQFKNARGVANFVRKVPDVLRAFRARDN
jgi:thiol-disulfide isomerase/thioredoxin